MCTFIYHRTVGTVDLQFCETTEILHLTGFGHQVALKLDSMGCHVIAACYTEEGEEILKQKASSRLCTVRLDITKTESIKEAFQFVKDKVPEKLGK